MSKDMLGAAVRKLVALPKDRLGTAHDFLVKIADPKNLESAKQFLRGELPGKSGAKVKPMASGLFEIVRRVKLPELAEFRPADKIVVMPERDRATAPVPIGYVDPDLTALMNRIGVEPTKGKLVLTVRKTLQQATFGEMLPALPRQAKRVSIGRVLQMVEKQGRGEEGDLLVNGWANFFLLEEDPDVVLDCYWHPDYRCWHFDLCPTSDSYQWGDGRRFLS